MTTDARDFIMTLSTGSRLGQLVIETLVDSVTGERVTLAFADGCPIDYPVFLQAYLGHILNQPSRLNERSRQIDERIRPLWSRVSLPETAIRRLEKLAIYQTLEMTVREFYQAHAPRDGMTNLEQIALFAEQVETAFEQSLASPTTVTGLSDLYAPQFYRPIWMKTVDSATRKTRNMLSMYASGHL